MNLTETIQFATCGGATAAFILMLNNTSSAATPYAYKQPVQTTISVPVFIDNPAFAVTAEPQLMLFDRHLKVPVITAPLWLIQRMEALRQMPPPTLQEVETSFRAAEAMRSNYEGNPISYANGRKITVT